MKRRYLFVLLFVLVVAAILAFFLRGVVAEVIILPVARFFWLVGGYYRVFPQASYWVVALIAVATIVLTSLRVSGLEWRRRDSKWTPLSGQVQDLSFWIKRSRKGIYPKWHVARLLAEMALELMGHHEKHVKNVLRAEDLAGSPPESVRKYLNAALNTNFTDYARSRPLTPLPPTPFDGDLEPVIRYLESLAEREYDIDS
jgi:hypothetical protein